ncbi:MAG: allantoate amidohydrolase [Chloroflexales bacterium]|nr:allantoate amidohydrolase [Chloroflexales bacterium]
MNKQLAQLVMERIEILAEFSVEPGRLTRPSFTDALRQANNQVSAWMQAAGMTTYEDGIGNLIGHYPADRSNAKAFILGSHLDSVRDAGKYDGPLGILVALAAVEELHQRGMRLPFAIEIMAFADEEGLRFQKSFVGSSVIAGRFDPQWLALTDADGATLEAAIQAFGGDLSMLEQDAKNPVTLLGYCEVHIEQGPLLEAQNLPVGIVTAIAGSGRANLRFDGTAGHAGTTPMDRRYDALCAAAEFVLAAEALASSQPGMVATVGKIAVQPGASNVIPGCAQLSLDLRHPDNTLRDEALLQARTLAEQISAKRGVALEWNVVQANPTTLCSPKLNGLLARAIETTGHSVIELPSMAGHDAISLATITDAAMLFVRCKDGISHNPAESVTTEDVAVSIEVISRLLELLAHE